MEALYHQTNKMVHEIQDGLGRVERASENDMHVVENEVSWLAAVCMMCVSLSCISITVHVFSIHFCTWEQSHFMLFATPHKLIGISTNI